MGLVDFFFKNQINNAVNKALEGLDNLQSPFVGSSIGGDLFHGNETDLGFLAYQRFLWVYNAVYITSTNASRVPFKLNKIGSDVEIGRFVTIGQHATIGGNFVRRDSQGRTCPCVADYAWVATGAVVAGPIDVGSAAVSGANAEVRY